MAVNYTDVQKTEKYISRTNFDALEMAAVPEGTEFNIVDQIHESDLDSDVLQKLNNNVKINTANTFTAAQTFKKDITIEGNIIQNGSAYETHAEKLYTKNDMIYTRDGATAALADDAYTGIQAVKYDGTNDGQLVFGKDGVARVGDVGNTQPLATRAEKNLLTDGHVLQWDAAGQTLVDSGRKLDEFARVEGDNIFTGANTFTDSVLIQGAADTVGLNVSDPSNPKILAKVLRHQIFVADSSNGMKVSLCSAGKLTVQDSNTSAKYQPGKITYNGKDLLFPETEAGGTFALTKDLPEANPTAEGTVALTKLKVGDVVYTIPNGGGSGDVTAAGDNTFTGSNIFTKGIEVFGHEGNPLQNTLYKVDKDGFTVVTGNAPYYSNKVKFNLDTSATSAKEYTIATNEDLDKKQPLLVSGTNIKTINGQSILGNGNFEISGGSGDVTAAGNNYFSGENTFTKKVIFSSLTESADFVGKPSFKAGIEITAGAVTSVDKTFNLPNKSGVFAITDDIPISSATLSDNGTTLTLVLK